MCLQNTAILVTSVLGIGICVCLYRWYRRHPWRKVNAVPLVPGGKWIFGNVLDIQRDRPFVTFSRWAEQYGDVYRIRAFGEDWVVLSSLETIREALVQQNYAFAGRPPFFRIHYGFYGKEDLIFGNFSAEWAKKKKLLSECMARFGAQNSDVETAVDREVALFVDDMEHQSKMSDGFNPEELVLTHVVNALTMSIMNTRYDKDNPRIVEYKETIRLFSEACSMVDGAELDMFPWLRFFPNTAFRKLTRARRLLSSWVDVELAEKKKTFNPDMATCILDKFLQHSTNHLLSPALTSDDVRTLFIDLLVSGTFTTSVALNSLLLVLSEHQTLQDQIRSKLRDVSGPDKFEGGVALLKACILEVHRWVSIVPLALPHYTLTDCKISSYTLPPSCKVIINLWHLHHDPAVWPEPLIFDPRRFMQDNDTLLPPSARRRQSLLPFSAGRRSCPGESLSLDRVYHFASSLLRNHRILRVSEPNHMTSLESFQLGLILQPPPYLVKIEKTEQ